MTTKSLGSFFKTLAVILMVIGVIGSLIAGVSMMNDWRTQELGAAVLIGGIIGSLLSGMMLYMMGAIAVDVAAIREKLEGSDAAAVTSDEEGKPVIVMKKPGRLGATVIEQNGRHGLSVKQVEAGQAADQAGIRSGDVLLSVDGRELHEVSELQYAISVRGQVMKFVVARKGGSEEEIEISF